MAPVVHVRHGDGVRAGDSSAEHDDLRRVGAGNSGDEESRASVRLEHRVRPDDRGESSGHLAHGGKKRQRARGQLHGLVGDRGDLRFHQCSGQVRLSGEVQVGEDEQVLAEVVVLARDRLLHLEQQVRLGPGLVGACRDRCSRRRVLRVGDGRPFAGSGFDGDPVPVGHEIVDSSGGYRNPELVVLDLPGDGDLHCSPALPTCGIRATPLCAHQPPQYPAFTNDSASEIGESVLISRNFTSDVVVSVISGCVRVPWCDSIKPHGTKVSV